VSSSKEKMKKSVDIVEEYASKFKEKCEAVASAPGRVNLIGEHTDYNKGFVLPMAVERRVWAAGKPASEGVVELASAGMPGHYMAAEKLKRTRSWADYPLGVIWALREEGWKVPGVRIFFHGNVPLGGGLSSSAAIEVATAQLLKELFELPISAKHLALTCQLAENQFVGIRCGAMDQMASALSEKGRALHIDCKDLRFQKVPLDMGNHKVVIINTGVKRELAAGKYNNRRTECEEAAKKLGVKSLRHISPDDMHKIEALPEPLDRRARHVVTENDRVSRAVECLSNGDIAKFGNLMNASHLSLRDDYEVSIPELDFLVDESNKLDGVSGARLTGAGFGGCVVVLAHKDAVPEIKKRVLSAYRKKFTSKPSLLTSTPAEGTRTEKFDRPD